MAIHIHKKLPDAFKELTMTQFKKRVFATLIKKFYYDVNDYLNDKNIL